MSRASNALTIDAQYDPVVRRYRAECPVCGYAAVRAKRDAALHVLAQHVVYAHERAVKT